jgi:large subunit ribosomal protein L14e
VDGPNTGVARQVVPFKRIMLTDLTVKVQRNARQKAIVKAWEDGDTQAKWDATSWAKKIQKRSVRAGLSDFDRFKAMVAKKQKAEIIAKKVAELS